VPGYTSSIVRLGQRSSDPPYISFRYRLTGYVLAVVVLILLAIGAIDYSRMRSEYAESVRRVEADVVGSLRLISEAYRVIESTLRQEMRSAMESFQKAYVEAGSVPGAVNLEELREETGGTMDLYLIDPEGVVRYSTRAMDIGLELGATPDAREFLEDIRRSGEFRPQRMSRESQTGKLRKYAYQAAPEGDWILELAVTTDAIAEYLAPLDPRPVAERLVEGNAMLDDLRILDMDGWEVSLHEPAAPDPELAAIAREVADSGETAEIERGGNSLRYVYVDVGDPQPHYAGIARVVELTYDRGRLLAKLLIDGGIMLAGQSCRVPRCRRLFSPDKRGIRVSSEQPASPSSSPAPSSVHGRNVPELSQRR